MSYYRPVAMEDLLQLLFGLFELIGFIVDLSDGARAIFDGRLLPLEWFGFVGASTLLVLSFGKVQWENKDWRAVGSGMLLLMGGLGLIVWGGFSHYQSSHAA